MTTTTHDLKASICYAAEDLLRAENCESASIPMGDNLILIGPRSELARMLSYNLADEAATLSAITGAARLWLGLNAAGRVAMFWTKEPRTADYPALTITGHVTMPLIREGDKLPPAAAAAGLPADDRLTEAYELGLRKAAQVCHAKYEARVASGHPREASTARALTNEILGLAGVAALPADPVDESQPAGLREALTRIIDLSSLGSSYGLLADGYCDQIFNTASAALDGKPLPEIDAPVVAPVPAAQEGQGWTKNTGARPVADGVLVQVEVRDGLTMRRDAGRLDWSIEGVQGDIVRWRLAPAMEAQSHE